MAQPKNNSVLKQRNKRLRGLNYGHQPLTIQTLALQLQVINCFKSHYGIKLEGAITLMYIIIRYCNYNQPSSIGTLTTDNSMMFNSVSCEALRARLNVLIRCGLIEEIKELRYYQFIPTQRAIDKLIEFQRLLSSTTAA